MASRIRAALAVIFAVLLCGLPARGEGLAGRPIVRLDVPYGPDARVHRLDVYRPSTAQPSPVAIWIGGSAWLRNNGKDGAGRIAEPLNAAGFTVVGVSVRSSMQAKFPAQVHDIRAAVRFLRRNAGELGIDPRRIAVMGDSSGAWVGAMAAVTSGLEVFLGEENAAGASSAVQAAVLFFPPTDFAQMDRDAPFDCRQMQTNRDWSCHADSTSPESRLLGCPLETCGERAAAANPVAYVGATTPAMLLLHGDADPLVPYRQSERLYEALARVCRPAELIRLPGAGHGPALRFVDGRSAPTASLQRTGPNCVKTAEPVTPTWDTVVAFLRKHLGS